MATEPKTCAIEIGKHAAGDLPRHACGCASTESTILQEVGAYYARKLSEHGTTARGVDWNSDASQALRFEQLLKVVDSAKPFSINDFGCGYGALVDALEGHGWEFDYRGFDVAPAMVEAARQRYGDRTGVRFTSDADTLQPADYTIASGIFNVRLRFNDNEWEGYVFETLERLAGLSTKGFAFNVLSTYSDLDRRRGDLYYADPLYYFDQCKRRFSRFVTLVHDYPLYEFTLLVRL